MKGFLGLVVLIVNIIATLEIVKSTKESSKKIIWLLVVWLIPGVGVVLYYVMGRK